MLLLEKRKDSFVDIQGVADSKRPAALNGGVNRMVEATLNVLDALTNVPNGRVALFGEFKPFWSVLTLRPTLVWLV